MACGNCNKTCLDVKLKACAKCNTTEYCSRQCQKQNWKTHKKICAAQAAARSAPSAQPTSNAPDEDDAYHSPPQGLRSSLTQPFTHLRNGTYLHNRPKADVYALLIDAYRLRAEDAREQIGAPVPDTKNPAPAFRSFLEAAAHAGILPQWWGPESTVACLSLGLTSSFENWHDLYFEIEPEDVSRHYGDEIFIDQLRLLACYVHGLTVNGREDWNVDVETMAEFEAH
ncbi:hypothetical protein ACHAQA_002727 [Verticillium albo-atrum]